MYDVDGFCDAEKFRESDESVYPTNTSVVIRVALTILLRAGFLLVQVGNIPVSNVNLILLHNIVEITWVTICYILMGSAVASTGDGDGFLGGGYWIGDDRIDRERIVIIWQRVLVASGIFTNCIAGRMHTVGTLVIGIVFGGFLQPLIMHWGTNGWMIRNSVRDGTSGFIDDGGGALVHATGGLLGLVGCLVLGRKVDGTGVDANAGVTFAGYFFILLGLQSLKMSNPSGEKFPSNEGETHLTMINNLLSISTCAIVTIAFHFFGGERFNRETVMRCVQGMIAGDVVVSAGANIYPPYVALTLGAVNGIIFYFTVRIITQSAVEDYCNSISIHLVSGLLGALVVPFFKKSQDKFNVINSLLDFSWQLICLLSIIGAIILIMTSLFMGLRCCGVLRNRSEHLSHLRAAVTNGQTPRSLIQRLFYPDVQASLMLPGTQPSRESETVTDSRSVKHESSVARLEMPDQGIIDSKVQHNNAVVVQPESKLRKVRNIHTIRSMDNFENNTPMSIMTTHELHRTFSTMDISKERSIEHVDVEVLVEPRFSLESSESEENIFHRKNSVTRYQWEVDLGGGDRSLK
ncbi:ammonium transporter 3-like [Fopius arisanus]|uniref:Ammonium transporter 3-like n=1 Tax=Fopius arisanus TaxID=64838 RepID=A0A9R1U838_9HYME|nr:PREDICTED: ammonium transporter 3-like [Fopius arisanus]